MRIIFDLSGTVFGLLDLSLRPGIRETIAALRSEGHTVEFWTNGPLERYERLLALSGIDGRLYSKLKPLPFRPDICVDDDPDFAVQSVAEGRVLKVRRHVADDMPAEPITLDGICA